MCLDFHASLTIALVMSSLTLCVLDRAIYQGDYQFNGRMVAGLIGRRKKLKTSEALKSQIPSKSNYPDFSNLKCR